MISSTTRTFGEYLAQVQRLPWNTQLNRQGESERIAGRRPQGMIELERRYHHSRMEGIIKTVVGVALLAFGSLITYVSISSPFADKLTRLAFSSSVCGLGLTLVYFGYNESVVHKNLSKIMNDLPDYIIMNEQGFNIDRAKFRTALLKDTVIFDRFIHRYVPSHFIQ